MNLEMNFRAIAFALCAAVKLHANFAENGTVTDRGAR